MRWWHRLSDVLTCGYSAGLRCGVSYARWLARVEAAREYERGFRHGQTTLMNHSADHPVNGFGRGTPNPRNAGFVGEYGFMPWYDVPPR
jgi:hypothetical protein